MLVGSISDVQQTSASGFLVVLENKPGISIMANRGFTIKDSFKKLNSDLNPPPFMKENSSCQLRKFQKNKKLHR